MQARRRLALTIAALAIVALFLPAMPLALADEPTKTYTIVSTKGKAVTLVDGQRVLKDAALTFVAVVENQPIKFRDHEARRFTIASGQLSIDGATYTMDAGSWRGVWEVTGKLFAARGQVSDGFGTYTLILIGKLVDHTPDGEIFRIASKLTGESLSYRLGFLAVKS